MQVLLQGQSTTGARGRPEVPIQGVGAGLCVTLSPPDAPVLMWEIHAMGSCRGEAPLVYAKWGWSTPWTPSPPFRLICPFNPGGGGSPPPYAWHRYGNLQMLPRPTAKPTQLSRYCSLLSHLGLSSSLSPLSPLSLLLDPQVLAMLAVGAAGNTTAHCLYKGTRRSLLIANHQPGLHCPWASHPSTPKASGSFTFSSPSAGGTGLRPTQPPTPTIMATVLPT